MKRVARSGLGAAMIAGAAAGASAQSTNYQFWPEIDFIFAFTPETQITFLGNLTTDRETPGNVQGQLGIDLEHRFDDIFSATAGYRLVASLKVPDEVPEQRFQLDQSFRLGLPEKFVLKLRAREEFRILETGFAFRLRGRVRFERDLEIDGYTFTPYGSGEVFFDTRFQRVSLYEFRLGANLPITREISVDLYLARQDQVQPPPQQFFNALGLTVMFQF